MTIDPLFEYLLRLGDNGLVLSHRLSEWVGHAPAIEEELALGNVALDLLGQAQMWLGLAAEVENKGRDADKLVYLRDAGGYRNLLLVEQPNSDFAHTMTRQYFFDVWHVALLAALTQSANARIAEIAAKAQKEAIYHLRRSRDWLVTLGDGTEESHKRMTAAVADLWSYTGELFEMDDTDQTLLERGIAPDLGALRDPWRAQIASTFRDATLTLPQDGWAQRGGKRGVHSEHLGFLLAELQFLQRAYPNANW